MAEAITKTLPAIPAVVVEYQVVYLELDWERARIVVKLHGSDGSRLSHNYRGDTATQLMRALNTANLSAASLHRRVLQRLAADNVISGPIIGAPD